MQVLVDTEDTRLVPRLRRMLKRHGHQVISIAAAPAYDPRQGGALIIDARTYGATTPLPETSGPLIFLSAPGQPDLRDRILARGARTVVHEPLRAATLDLAITTAMARYRTSAYYRQQVRELHWLQEAVHQLAACETADAVLWLVADLVQHELGYDRVGINLIDHEHNCLREWLNTDPDGRRAVRPGEMRPLADDSPVWQSRQFRELLREGRDFYYSSDTWAETPPDARYHLDGRIREQLSVPMRVDNQVVGWISVDNLPSGRHVGPEDAPTLLAFAREAALAIGKIQAHAVAERRAREFAILVEVGEALVAQREPRTLCAVAVEQLACRFGYDLVSIYLREGANLRLQAHHGYDEILDPQQIGERGVAARTVRTGASQFVPDAAADPDFLAAVPGIVAGIYVPILGAEQVVGILSVESRQPGILDRQAQELLEVLARQVALALERAHLLETERRRARVAEALKRATAVIASSLEAQAIRGRVIELMREVVAFDRATLFAIEAGVVRYLSSYEHVFAGVLSFAVAHDPIFAAWLHEERATPELIEDTQADPRWAHLGSANTPYIAQVRCYLGAPLLIDGAIVGALCLGSERPHAFDAVDVAATAEFAERLSRALRNAQLYRAEQERARLAEELAALRSDFLSAVSHELRTPLTAVVGFAELLAAQWEGMDATRCKGYLAKIVAAANRQQRLVLDLLEVTRIESGAWQAKREAVAVGPVLEQAAAEVRSVYSGQVIALSGPAGTRVLGDADRTLQILVNLIDNAAKYSPEGSPVEVTWERAGELVEIRVRDHGPGIAEEARRRLFTRFGRLTGSRTRAGRTGTGLGLYLSRRLAQAMDGALDLEQSGPEGSAFRLLLPVEDGAPRGPAG